MNDRRATAFRALQIAVCAGVGMLLAVLSPGIPWGRWPELLFFTALTTLALRLRIRYAGNFVGVEAAALVPAILLLGSPGAADARLPRRRRGSPSRSRDRAASRSRTRSTSRSSRSPTEWRPSSAAR